MKATIWAFGFALICMFVGAMFLAYQFSITFGYYGWVSLAVLLFVYLGLKRWLVGGT